MYKIILAIIIYYVIINLIASAMALSDKKRAQNDKWRISEAALMTAAFLGGAAGELFTMKKIRHKTKHAKFMIGLPIALFIHTVIIVIIFYKTALC